MIFCITLNDDIQRIQFTRRTVFMKKKIIFHPDMTTKDRIKQYTKKEKSYFILVVLLVLELLLQGLLFLKVK
jgi:hypothetical protein